MSAVQFELSLFNLDVALTLPGFGVSVITGPSGAGKTTLLRAVAGLEPDCKGRVEVNGVVWQDDLKSVFVPVHQRGVGFVFQDAELFPHLSVQENIEFGLKRTAIPDRKTSMSQVIELLGLGSLLSRDPSSLSGGEKQRVAIGRALANSPKILLMDEPLASLDEQRKAEILPYLENLHRALEIPVLYVSHAMDEVARLADFLVLLEAGKVRAAGNVFELIARPDLPLAFGDQACALISAKITGHDERYQLTQVAFAGGSLWLPRCQMASGTSVRLRIQASDVSLSLHQQSGSSILNTIPVSIVTMRDDVAGLLLVELDAKGTRLLARITNKSADLLQFRTGMAVFAQIKSVATLK